MQYKLCESIQGYHGVILVFQICKLTPSFQIKGGYDLLRGKFFKLYYPSRRD